MRCYCCNRALSTQESTRKFEESGEYVDMCNTCLASIEDDIPYNEGNVEEEEDGTVC
jgi:hypothetical protein